MHIQVTLRSRRRDGARCIRMKVRQVPALQKIAESFDARVVFEGAQGGDAQLAQIGQLDQLFGRVFLANRHLHRLHRLLARPDRALAVLQAQKWERSSVFLPFAALLQHL